MKVPRDIYRFVEYELYHYKEYKARIELEKRNILDSSSNLLSGMPRSNKIANEPLHKTIDMNESPAIVLLTHRVNVIENAIKRLSDTEKSLFDILYINGKKNVYNICAELLISERTFQRYKSNIIIETAMEMGLV